MAPPSSTACAGPAASGSRRRRRSARAGSRGRPAVGGARPGRDPRRLALRGRRGRARAGAAPRPEPRAQSRLPARAEPRRRRSVGRDPPGAPQHARPAHYDARGYDILQELLVRAYADGWRVVEVPIDYEPAHPGARIRARSAWAPTTCAASGRCGSCATRSSPPTTTIARTTAPSGCSATGSASASSTSPSWSRARAACSTSAAGRAGSSGRWSRTASASTSCAASCATRGASGVRSCTVPGVPRCRCPTPASSACCARR